MEVSFSFSFIFLFFYFILFNLEGALETEQVKPHGHCTSTCVNFNHLERPSLDESPSVATVCMCRHTLL